MERRIGTCYLLQPIRRTAYCVLVTSSRRMNMVLESIYDQWSELTASQSPGLLQAQLVLQRSWLTAGAQPAEGAQPHSRAQPHCRGATTQQGRNHAFKIAGVRPFGRLRYDRCAPKWSGEGKRSGGCWQVKCRGSALWGSHSSHRKRRNCVQRLYTTGPTGQTEFWSESETACFFSLVAGGIFIVMVIYIYIYIYIYTYIW